MKFLTVFNASTGDIEISRGLTVGDDDHLELLVSEGRAFVIDETCHDTNRERAEWQDHWAFVEKPYVQPGPTTYTRATLNSDAAGRITHPDAYPLWRQMNILTEGSDEERQQMRSYINAVRAVANSSEGKPLHEVEWPDLADHKPDLMNAPQFNVYTPIR